MDRLQTINHNNNTLGYNTKYQGIPYMVVITCSSPRKENNRKPPTGENVIPRKQIIKVNPNRGKQGGIPEKESPGIANTKGNPNGHQTELLPLGFSLEFSRQTLGSRHEIE